MNKSGWLEDENSSGNGRRPEPFFPFRCLGDMSGSDDYVIG
jgi:hypothetical protein